MIPLPGARIFTSDYLEGSTGLPVGGRLRPV